MFISTSAQRIQNLSRQFIVSSQNMLSTQLNDLQNLNIDEYVKTQKDSTNITHIKGNCPRKLYELFRGEHMSCGTETIDPKSEVPYHLHTDEEEILFCTKGKGKIFVQNQERDFYPGVMVYVPKLTLHRIVNLSETEELHLTWTLSPPAKVQKFKAGVNN
ncbi:RmlC-like cupin domain [Pseudocohnilembus persalinus]|uniref:RmlC-like cupin domain n=1 Tax=Pseudocohnilembus persalinus TaxID=266149 RepID=A0A0V0QHE3_PSEPJ|nr:RmlC-like cupin domain [Pseudocohnilembus persalinus]|eukprot:KRX01677.1 RmlC-like cupin domain [Pseudocohnilembus persalinus]